MTRIIDTSVVIKWYVAEDNSDRAIELLGKPFVAPDLLIYELANAVWKKVRRTEITTEQAALALVEVQNSVEIVSGHQFHRRALEIAIELDHPVYDCFFLALAEAARQQLVTSDARLVRACVGRSYHALIESL